MIIQAQTQNLVEVVESLPNFVKADEFNSFDPFSKGTDVGLFVVLDSYCLISVAVFLAYFGLQLVEQLGSLLTTLFLALSLFGVVATLPVLSLTVLFNKHVV